ncbi:class I SAM-dependent methyltransferase [Arthrobacter sp. H14]|uniref:class I SAM-dependent methyltransferase n=1 Tax=Arthrobacter sp. H14 TaxID=1312959 RepID=UPI0004AEBC2D|nr:class I SAM-dependent methyltransferase [Arthrobacter sp. H14]
MVLSGPADVYIGRVSSLINKLLLLPRVLRLSAKVPKDPHVAWNQYWAGVEATGAGGDVLWDAGDERELNGYLERLRHHLDPGLPIIDVGCGHGSFTRSLARYFPQAVGVDVSAHAVERAQNESSEVSNVTYRVLDCTADGSGAALRAEFGEANVFVRGVFHVLDRRARAALAANLHPVVGGRGRVFLAETDFQGNGLQYMAHLGAVPGNIPAPLERAIANLPRPGHFGRPEREAAFDAGQWVLCEDGATSIETVPMSPAGKPERIPGYFAVLGNRNGAQTP